DKVPAFLDSVKDQFDLVIVDTPPVLAATDPMIIGRYASTNLMVVRHNTTSLHEIKEVKRLYEVNNLEISGVILNCYDQKSGKYGQYGYTYGYQYNYESSD
ncbi:MAG: tyrosine protein kinase, partial [Pseudomonadota bacterium]